MSCELCRASLQPSQVMSHGAFDVICSDCLNDPVECEKCGNDVAIIDCEPSQLGMICGDCACEAELYEDTGVL